MKNKAEKNDKDNGIETVENNNNDCENFDNDNFAVNEITFYTKNTDMGYRILNINYENKIEIKNLDECELLRNNFDKLINHGYNRDINLDFKNEYLVVLPSMNVFWNWILRSDYDGSDHNGLLFGTSVLNDDGDKNEGRNFENEYFDNDSNNNKKNDSDGKKIDDKVIYSNDNIDKSYNDDENNDKVKLPISNKMSKESFQGFKWLDGVKNPYGHPDTVENEKSDEDENKQMGNKFEVLLDKIKENDKSNNSKNYNSSNVFNNNNDFYSYDNNKFDNHYGDNINNDTNNNSKKLEIFQNSYKIDYDRY